MKPQRIGPLDPIFDVETTYGGIAVGATPATGIITVTINEQAGQDDPVVGIGVFFDVVFSESVSGFTGSDLTVYGSSLPLAATVSGSGDTYTVEVTGMTVTGVVRAKVNSGTVIGDVSGDTNRASTSTDNTVNWEVVSMDNIAHWWDMSQSARVMNGSEIDQLEDLIGNVDLIGGVGVIHAPVLTTVLGHDVAESYGSAGSSDNTNAVWRGDITDIPIPWSMALVWGRRNTGFNPGGGTILDIVSDAESAFSTSLFSASFATPDYIGWREIASWGNIMPAFAEPYSWVVIGNGTDSEIWLNGALLDDTIDITRTIKKITVFNTVDTDDGNDLFFMELQVAPGVTSNPGALSTSLLAKWS